MREWTSAEPFTAQAPEQLMEMLSAALNSANQEYSSSCGGVLPGWDDALPEADSRLSAPTSPRAAVIRPGRCGRRRRRGRRALLGVWLAPRRAPAGLWTSGSRKWATADSEAGPSRPGLTQARSEAHPGPVSPGPGPGLGAPKSRRKAWGRRPRGRRPRGWAERGPSWRAGWRRS